MARIRTIKPEFPQSESMGRVSRDARLCFIELWTIADDSGRTRASSRMLASLLFPYDDDAPALIDGWLSELEREGCIMRYEVGGQHYIQIDNWLQHQKIDRPSKSLFPPFANPREPSSNPRDLSSEDQGPRTKDQGRDQGEYTGNVPDALESKPITESSPSNRIEKARSAWNESKIGPEDRFLLLNHRSEDSRELLRILNVYSDAEISTALKNYIKIKNDPGNEILPYQSFVAFMSKGVEKYLTVKPGDFKKKEVPGEKPKSPDRVCEVCGRVYVRSTVESCFTCGNELGHPENFEQRTGITIETWREQHGEAKAV